MSLSALTNIGVEQRHDPRLHSIIEGLISTSLAPSVRMFELKDGILKDEILKPDRPRHD